MVKATDIQVGTTGHRIYREPVDAETVLYSYSDLMDRVTMTDYCHTLKGTIYAGMITSVVNDTDAKNGPYYISYIKTGPDGNKEISYTTHKIVTEDDIKSVVFSWGTLD